MTGPPRPEVWLQGPVHGVSQILQPVAHGLLHAADQIREAISSLTSAQLIARPGQIASISFHVRHAVGSLDRLFTYAKGESLSAIQLDALAAEKTVDDPSVDVQSLLDGLDAAVERALDQLRETEEATVSEHRSVGRAQLPSTVLGLLFHGAEHTARHAGQIVTTAKLVKGAAGI